MLSISFLPWLLLLLGIVAAIPIVNFVETSRRKKALAAAAPPAEEVAMEDAQGAEADGFGDEPIDAFAADDAASGDFAQPADDDMAAFDEDAFK